MNIHVSVKERGRELVRIYQARAAKDEDEAEEQDDFDNGDDDHDNVSRGAIYTRKTSYLTRFK